MSFDSGSGTFITRLGKERLQILSKLGDGASGAVFRARDRETGRMVALKVLKDATPQKVERFRREAEVAASLSHPSIVPVLTAGVFEGHFFIAYELIEGARTLEQVLPGLALRARVEALRDVARALGHAHARGVVHRDVKPANILVATDGRVLLTDFGLAAAEGQERMTRTGAAVGTPHYMAPEQINGRGAAPTPATDVWALGVLLYEVLTGRLPFNAESLVELATKIIAAAPERPSQVRPDASPGLETVCLRALQTDPTRRPADGDALADDLDAWLMGSTVSAARPRALLPRARTTALVAAALVSGAAVLGAIAYDPRPAPPPPRPTAPRQAVATTPAQPVVVAPVVVAPVSAVKHVPPWERDDGANDVIIKAAKQEARDGSKDGLYLLGGLYDTGSGLPLDDAAAMECFAEAARRGHLEATFRVGEMRVKGAATGVPDAPGALPFLTSAAERGHGQAMTALARVYLGRPGVPEDLSLARVWLERAAEQELPDAQFELALMLVRGEGGPPDGPRAIALLKSAARREHGLAMRALGRALLEGRHVARDEAAGARWIKQAYDQGNVEAGLLWAELVADGRGVPADPQAGKELWIGVAERVNTAAANDNLPRLMVLLAHVYTADRWTVPDPGESRRWLERAAAMHDPEARRILAHGWDEWDE